jgi:SAM-dependent methyltransferase
VAEHSHENVPLWSGFDLIEGFFLSQAFAAIERLGILDALKLPQSANGLARRYHVNESILDAALQMLASRTLLIRYAHGKYSVTSAYDSVTKFFLLQYLASYGGNAVHLEEILHDPSVASQFVDRYQHQRAFLNAQTSTKDPLVQQVLQSGFNTILDIGCGTGSLLLHLASQCPHFRGWGIDSNLFMCRAARQRIAQARESKRIKIIHGDSRQLLRRIAPTVVRHVEAITASGVANEFFFDGINNAVSWLSAIKRVFPGRKLLIADYYGQLGFRRKSLRRGVALHDFIQVISRQGVPPPNRNGWLKVYKSAKCKLLHVEHERGAPNFIHVVQL